MQSQSSNIKNKKSKDIKTSLLNLKVYPFSHILKKRAKLQSALDFVMYFLYGDSILSSAF